MFSSVKKLTKFLRQPRTSILNRLQNWCNHYLREKLRKSLASCGEQVGFQMPICIEGAANVKIGNRVSMAAFVHIWGQGGVEIGDDTLIASHVAITSLTHDTTATLFAKSLISKPVIIGRNVWIGSHATILPGIRVGDGAIIGAGAVVTNDVPENTIVVGVPAKVIKNRFPTGVSNLNTLS